MATKTAGEVVAIDGKSLRRSYDKDHPKSMLHMVSAWASGQRLVLAQQTVDAKSNEIAAIPALLDVLDVRVATIDAMGNPARHRGHGPKAGSRLRDRAQGQPGDVPR